MAEPLHDPTVQEMLRRSYVHSKDLNAVIEALKVSLGENGIPYAVVGAVALGKHNFSRFTEDIDLLTTREGLDAIHEKLVGTVLALRGRGLRKSFKEPVHAVKIDVITAGEHAGSEKSPVVFPDPRSDAFVDIGGLRVPTLATLIELKIASGIWGHRSKDFGDVEELIKYNHLDETFADQIRPELRANFLERVAYVRQQRPDDL